MCHRRVVRWAERWDIVRVSDAGGEAESGKGCENDDTIGWRDGSVEEELYRQIEMDILLARPNPLLRSLKNETVVEKRDRPREWESEGVSK